MRLPAFTLLFLLSTFAIAAEEPEAVYARFHRAAVSGNLEEMVRYAPPAQRAELSTMSAAQKEATVKMMAALLPRAYLLHTKTVNPNGQAARLIVSGASDFNPGDKPETLYGTIRMEIQGGEWKVAGMDWSNNRPAGVAEGRPALKAAPAPAAKAQAAPAARGPVNAVGTPVEKKLGTAKPPCVYKPVMTAEDMENCR
jgi:hypothetical protein